MAKGYYNELIKILREHGFEYVRQAKGSHERWGNADGVEVTVPPNSGSRHTANAVLKQAGIDRKL